MAYSVDRKAPGVFGTLFGAVLSLVLGGLLALVHLAAQPVEVLKTAPKEPPAEGARVFILGASGGAGRSWQAKRERLAAGAPQGVVFTEAELNAWAEETFQPVKLDDEAKKSSVTIAAGAPNFRIEDSLLQVGLVNNAHFFGKEAPLVLWAKGRFEKADKGWVYRPEEAMLGGLPLHKIPALLPQIARRFGAGNLPEEVVKVLSEAREIEVGKSGLTVVLP